jgi:hypothetical protein
VSVCEGIGSAGLDVGWEGIVGDEVGREDMVDWDAGTDGGGRIIGRGNVALIVLISGSAAEECVEGAGMDFGTEISGGIHISMAVDSN